MLKTYTCIMCPRGCEITGNTTEDNVLLIQGNACPKGDEYVRQEFVNPMRTISTSIKIVDGEEELVSVRLNHPIPKKKIFDVMSVIRNTKALAPVQRGEVLISNVLGLCSDVIATKDVAKK